MSELRIVINQRDKIHQLRRQLAVAQARCSELVQICYEHGVYVDIKISTAALDAAIAAATKPLIDAVFPNGTEDGNPTVGEAIRAITQTQEDLREAMKQLRERDDFATRAATKPLVDALEKAADTFADLKLGLRLLRNPDVARACEIAEEETRKVIPK